MKNMSMLILRSLRPTKMRTAMIMPDITMNTRKGVYVSYVPAEKAG